MYWAVIKIVRCIWFNESIIQSKITLKVEIYVDWRVIFLWTDNDRQVYVDSRVIFLCLQVGNIAKIINRVTAEKKKKPRSYQTIWSFPLTNVKWHSVTWPYTMATPYWSDFVPNSTFYRILSGFHRTFATGVACRQGTLTPPDTLSRPFGIAYILLVETNPFPEFVVIFPDYALRISLGTFSILPLISYSITL